MILCKCSPCLLFAFLPSLPFFPCSCRTPSFFPSPSESRRCGWCGLSSSSVGEMVMWPRLNILYLARHPSQAFAVNAELVKLSGKASCQMAKLNNKFDVPYLRKNTCELGNTVPHKQWNTVPQGFGAKDRRWNTEAPQKQAMAGWEVGISLWGC